MSFLSGPLILIYNPSFGRWPNLLKLNAETTCRFTRDRRRLSEAAAVVFHLPTMQGRDYPDRYPGQVWVARCMESTSNVPALADPEFMKRFDLTIGYWREASVWTTYFGALRPARLLSPPMEKTEPAPAAYFQSSAVDRSGRITLVRELMKRMRVDSYGRVLNTRALAQPDKGRPTKLAAIARHKFTLAFENTITRDYVTEKFFDPLIAGSVPVYLGAPNVVDYTPGEDCFINAADFDGPASLANYLNALGEDEAAYGKYLAWKARPLRPQFLLMLETTCIPGLHRLCPLVRGQDTGHGSVADGLSRWGHFRLAHWRGRSFSA